MWQLAIVLMLAPPQEKPYVVVPSPRPWESAEFLKQKIAFRIPDAQAPNGAASLTAEEAGVARLQKGSALLFHSPGRKELAAEAAELVEKQNRLLYYYTRQELQLTPFVIIGTEEKPPKPFGFWVSLDKVPCWSLRTEELHLPLQKDAGFWAKTARSWLYHGSVHESFHHGSCHKLGLMPYRWFCEGVSDYLAALAAVCYAPDGDRAQVSEWIPKIETVIKDRKEIDLLDPKIWWNEKGGRAQNDMEIAAYGASMFAISELVQAHGYDWIRLVLADLARSQPQSDVDVVRAIEKHTGERNLEKKLRKIFLESVLKHLRRGVSGP